MLRLAATIEPLLKEFSGSGRSLPAGLGAAFQAAFLLHESLPSGEPRIKFLRRLGDSVRPFVSTFAAQENAGTFLLRSLPTIIDAALTAAEMELHLSQLSGLTARRHTAASRDAAQREDVETSIAEAKAACDRLSSNEMPEEVAAEVESSLRSVAVYLHQTGHPAEARCLLIARRRSVLARRSRMPWVQVGIDADESSN